MDTIILVIALAAFILSLVSYLKVRKGGNNYIAVVECKTPEETPAPVEVEAEADVPEEVAPQEAQSEEPKNFGLDPQIVAVLMAAVEAFEGEKHPGGFRVTNIQRVTGTGNAWANAGRNETLAASQR